MIHEDITISGSFQASGSFILPRIPSNSLATATTGSMFYDTVNDVVKIYTGTGSTTDGYITVGAQSSPATSGGGGPAASDDIEYLLIGGGSSGGVGNDRSGGGGGAGGYLSSSLSDIESGSQITVTVGAGGAAKTSEGQGNDGSNSTLVSAAGTSFTTVTALGGGGGGYPSDGRDGASGGGGAHGGTSGGSGTVGQGNDGGDGSGEAPYAGAGGGGAGTAGSNSSPGSAGTGGNGLTSPITGTSITRAGGGGGGGSVDAAGGTGGGGHGATNSANNGAANSGSGGGGAQSTSGAGSSGIAIITYPTSSIGAIGGIKKSRSDGQFYHVFKESATLIIGSSSDYPVAPSDNFNVILYNGNNSSQSITGVGFQPDLLWIKQRTDTNPHGLWDSSRGPGKMINPHLTTEETGNYADFVGSFDSDGFQVNRNYLQYTNHDTTNYGIGDAAKYVAYCWKAGLSGSISSITSTDIFTATSDNCSDSGDYIIGTKTYDFTTPTYVKGAYSYSVFGASARASNIRIEFSDDNSNWYIAYTTTMDNGDPVGCGIVNSGNYATETDTNVLQIGKHRYWRYVEATAITSHHPRVSRIGLYRPNYTGIVNRNADAGFSIVKYEGDGVAGKQITHELSAAPDMILVKNLSNAHSGNAHWAVYHTSLGATKVIYLNRTNAAGTSDAFWNDTAPSSTVFSIGDDNDVNVDGEDFIAYCFHNVEGYQKIGTYTGTGATGNVVTVGFKPKFVMVKSTTAAEPWFILDNVRDTDNPRDNRLMADSSAAEDDGSVHTMNFNSTSFTLNGTTGDGTNGSGETYLYWAISE